MRISLCAPALIILLEAAVVGSAAAPTSAHSQQRSIALFGFPSGGNEFGSPQLQRQESRVSGPSNAGAAVVATAAMIVGILGTPTASLADGQTKSFKLPPIDRADKNRCVLTSSAMGQANAARDKLYDLRECQLSGKDASGYDLSGVIMTKTDVSNAKFRETQFSKGYLHDSNFDGADFSNGIVDRASFAGSSLRGAIFANAVLTGTSFEGANVENADFSDAYIGDFDIRNLCKNPTLQGENPTTGADTYLSAGCGGIQK